MRLAAVTYLVRDYDEAIAWFSKCLKFTVVEDTALSGGKRWVKIASSNSDTCLLLAQAMGSQRDHVGKAAGGRVAYFLYTDDFAADHAHMKNAGVIFREEPRHEPYGVVAVFEDLYGNAWDLIEPAK